MGDYDAGWEHGQTYEQNIFRQNRQARGAADAERFWREVERRGSEYNRRLTESQTGQPSQPLSDAAVIRKGLSSLVWLVVWVGLPVVAVLWFVIWLVVMFFQHR